MTFSIISAPFTFLRNRPKVFLPLAILLFGILGAYALISARSDVETEIPKAPPPLIRALPVRVESLELKVPAQGTVTPRTETDLIAQVSGQIIEVSPEFANGGFFEEGDVLLRIDPRDYDLALALANVEVAQARVRYSQEQEETEVAQAEWAKIGEGDPSDLVLRKPQLAQARASLDAAQARYQMAKLNLERTEVRAPYAGRVRYKRVDVGQVVGPTAPLGKIYAVDFAEIRLPIPDQELEFLDVSLYRTGKSEIVEGPTVDLQADFAGHTYTWSGRVVRVEGEIDPLTRMINLVARVDDPYAAPEGSLRPPLTVGLYVEAAVGGKMVENAVVLPRAALRGRDRVLVVDEGRLYFRDVVVLRSDSEKVIITSGLKQGEHVCISPLDAVVDGMRVRSSVQVEGGVG
jgi:membrane fusion protein, multidrug efflux system